MCRRISCSLRFRVSVLKNIARENYPAEVKKDNKNNTWFHLCRLLSTDFAISSICAVLFPMRLVLLKQKHITN